MDTNHMFYENGMESLSKGMRPDTHVHCKIRRDGLKGIAGVDVSPM